MQAQLLNQSDDILLLILSYLPLQDLLALGAARKNWKLSQLSNSDMLWSKLVPKKLDQMQYPFSIAKETLEKEGYKQAFIKCRMSQLKTKWHFMGDNELAKQFKTMSLESLAHVKLGIAFFSSFFFFD